MSSIGTEALLAAVYAGFLLGAAIGLDVIARHTHHRSLRFRVAGFRYHDHLDAWECPEGQHLWPVEHDHVLRVVRYRGKPNVCNACPAKEACTDSDEGREVVRFLDPWFQLEAGRFHRAFALLLVVLSLVVAAIGLARNHAAAELAVLGAIVGVAAVMAVRLAAPLVGAISPAARSSGGEHRSL